MKKLSYLILSALLFAFACSKEEDENNTDANPTAAASQITYELDGKATTGNGVAYNFSDTAYFVKHEENGAQLSLYYNGTAEGTYDLGSTTFDKGKGFITYNPNANSPGGVSYLAISGTLKLTKIEGSKLTGTFSGIVQKAGGTETIQIKGGSFTSVSALVLQKYFARAE